MNDLNNINISHRYLKHNEYLTSFFNHLLSISYIYIQFRYFSISWHILLVNHLFTMFMMGQLFVLLMVSNVLMFVQGLHVTRLNSSFVVFCCQLFVLNSCLHWSHLLFGGHCCVLLLWLLGCGMVKSLLMQMLLTCMLMVNWCMSVHMLDQMLAVFVLLSPHVNSIDNGTIINKLSLAILQMDSSIIHVCSIKSIFIFFLQLVLMVFGCFDCLGLVICLFFFLGNNFHFLFLLNWILVFVHQVLWVMASSVGWLCKVLLLMVQHVMMSPHISTFMEMLLLCKRFRGIKPTLGKLFWINLFFLLNFMSFFHRSFFLLAFSNWSLLMKWLELLMMLIS